MSKLDFFIPRKNIRESKQKMDSNNQRIFSKDFQEEGNE